MVSTVLFLHNEHLATEALLGEAFTDCGFDVEIFGVVPADRVDDPAVVKEVLAVLIPAAMRGGHHNSAVAGTSCCGGGGA